MNKMLTMIIALLIPALSFGQLIDGFNSVPDTSYWDYEISASADSTLSFVNASYVTDPLEEGSHALQLDYSAHNIEGWGDMQKYITCTLTLPTAVPMIGPAMIHYL